ncbi:MAG: ABC transporter permease [Gammaproteobacteria bacterium]|nr:MAG: ABC transporter permease [Gammaproteobacteria bacterium]
MFIMFRALWQYRYFVLSSIKNEFTTRFARSSLGGLWVIFNPLAQVAIYALILSNVLAAKIPNIGNQYSFAIYLTAGILAWSLFSDIITRCLNLFIAQGNLLKKVMFPKVVLPTIVVGTSLLDNFMLFISILGIFALLGHAPTIQILWLPILTLATLALGISFGLILGVLNVFIRDIGQAVPIILQIAFWFTPIVYPLSIIPESYRYLLYFNPMYPIVKGYQDVLVYGTAPEFTQISIILAISMVLLGFGFFLFQRASEEMADVL